MRGAPSGKNILVVGLGNPGVSYSRHRHNVGFMVVEELANECGAPWRPTKEKGLVTDFMDRGKTATLMKPLTYMNLSGKAVAPELRRLNANPARMIIVHDDLDLAFSRVRIKVGGGDGGHKGIRSISDTLRFKDFIRVRVGIGRPPEGVSPESFVLSPFFPEEMTALAETITRAGEAVKKIILGGVEKAQNEVHSRRKANTA